MNMGGGWYGMGWGGPVMWILWILLAVIIFWVLKSLFSGGDNDSQDNPVTTPMEILQERFALGEIDEEEFQRRRDLLKQSNSR